MTRRVTHNRRKSLLLAAAWMGLAGSAAIAQISAAAHATSASERHATGTEALAFDVVSIRPSEPGNPAGYQVLPDGYRAIGMPLAITIQMAYLPMLYSSDERLKGAPPWVMNVPYDIVAKVAPADVVEWQRQKENIVQKEMLEAMLQVALMERCKLVVHRTPTEVAGYALMAGKHGPKLKEAKPDEPSPSGMMLPDGGKAIFSGKGNQRIEWTFFNTSMASLTAWLSMGTRSTIQDKTGLSGKYDFVLQKRDEGLIPAGQEHISAPDPSAPIPWDVEELGLKLKSAKVSAEGLVIDHIERPSEN